MLVAATLGAAQVVLKPTGAAALPLKTKSIGAEVVIDRQVAVTKLTLTFQNPSPTQIEADFIYTLPPETLISGFAYYFGDERVEARIVNRERARQIYERITIVDRRDPALVEMIGKRSFRARIFPVEANSDLRVEMTMVQALPSIAGTHQYVLPLRRAKGDALSSIDVAVKVAGSDRRQLIQNNFGLRADGSGLLRYRGQNVRPDKDLRVRITDQPQPGDGLTCALYSGRSGGREGYFAMAVSSSRGSISGPVRIEGVEVMGVRGLEAKKPIRSLLVTGRYRGSGRARVSAGGRSSSVSFSDASKPNHPGMKLWAAREIEALGKDSARVSGLSKRHNLPSRFTSWLAVPRAERAIYRQTMAETEIRPLIPEYLSALGPKNRQTPRSRAITARMRAMTARFQLPPEEVIQSALQGSRELIALRAADERLRGKSGEWLKRLHRLAPLIGEEPTWILESGMAQLSTDLSNLYVREIGAGRAEGPAAREARALLRRGQTLGKTSEAQVESALDSSLRESATRIVRARQAGQRASVGDDRRLKHLSEFLRRSPAQELKNARAEMLGEDIIQARQDIAELASAKGRNPAQLRAATARARRLLNQMPEGHPARMYSIPYQAQEAARTVAAARIRRSRDSGTERYLAMLGQRYAFNTEELVRQELKQQADMEWRNLHYLQSQTRYDRKIERDGRAKLARLAELGIQPDKNFAEGSPAETARLALLKELRDPSPDPARVSALNARLAKETGPQPAYGVGTEKMNDEERRRVYVESRLERLRTEIRLDQLEQATPSPEILRARKELEARIGELRARMGDPLLTFDAPSSARTVVAVMPDGEIKPLAWVASKSRWEVRFDVPAHAKEGPVTVQIVAVLANGERKVGTTTYHVDVSPPNAQVRAWVARGELWLEANGSSDLARVVAILPGADEHDLIRQPGTSRFLRRMPSVAEGTVRFVLFDKAHNRREIKALVR